MDGYIKFGDNFFMEICRFGVGCEFASARLPLFSLPYLFSLDFDDAFVCISRGSSLLWTDDMHASEWSVVLRLAISLAFIARVGSARAVLLFAHSPQHQLNGPRILSSAVHG